jgi:hypothetical protein
MRFLLMFSLVLGAGCKDKQGDSASADVDDGGPGGGGAGADAEDPCEGPDCPSACERANDLAAQAFEDCGLKWERQDESDCTEEKGEQYLCVSDCIVGAECGALDGSDVAQAALLAVCTALCV